MELINTLVAAKAYGSIGTRNTAMPGSAFALPPSKCLVGRKLAAIKGSVCHGCYAVKSEQLRPSVRKGWAANYEKALKLIAEKPEQWAQALAFQIKRYADNSGESHHRWFDAGDLQSVDMLRAIIRVCELTPAIKHWLPTREAKIVADWRAAGGVEPANLIIRISSTMIGDKPRNASHTSTVHTKGTFDPRYGHDCPKANKTHATNSCEDCRACWSRDVANVSYQFHR